MDFFRLEKPKSEKDDAVAVVDALENSRKRQEVLDFVNRANEPDYKYWDKVRHMKPLPASFSRVQAWAAVKLFRLIERHKTEIRAEDGNLFGWTKLALIERYCHEFDMHTGGEVKATVSDLRTDEKKRLISKGLMDEAIASAQLEGANTSRAYAEKMLREKIKPRNSSDQMILNNHKAMLAVEDEYKTKEMSLDLLNEIHSVLTEGTLDSDGKPPVLRDDTIDPRPTYVQDEIQGWIYHKAPKTDFVKKELKRLVHFANNESEGFLHPVVKAAMLHFWVGYLHPYTDGNGRLARVIFYWYLLKHEYWAFAYLPIAAKIKSGGKIGYTMSYVYSEQDDHDMTYFISYLLRKAIESNKELQNYIEKTRKTNKLVAFEARTKFSLNDRQIQLLKYLSTDKDHSTQIVSYQTFNGVSRATAINDLKELSQKGLTRKRKIGRNVFYYGTEEISKLFKQG